MSYEQLERQRLEQELAQERAEGQAQRSALRVQLRRLQSELDAARVDTLPHDWPTVKQIWIEGDMHKERHRRAGLALRDAQTLVEVLQDQVHAALTDVKNMHAVVAELERQHVEQVVLRAVCAAVYGHPEFLRCAFLLDVDQMSVQPLTWQHMEQRRLAGAEKRSAVVVAESLQHQLASAQAAWQDAEKERLEVSPLVREQLHGADARCGAPPNQNANAGADGGSLGASPRGAPQNSGGEGDDRQLAGQSEGVFGGFLSVRDPVPALPSVRPAHKRTCSGCKCDRENKTLG